MWVCVYIYIPYIYKNTCVCVYICILCVWLYIHMCICAYIYMYVIHAPANKARIQEILDEAPRPDWHVSAHSHVAIITSYLQDRLATEFPREVGKPLHPYFVCGGMGPAETGCLASQEVSKASVRPCAGRHSWQFFRARRSAPEVATRNSSAWLRDCQVAEALYGFRLGMFVKALSLQVQAGQA